ncbi:MAG: hypothetical protein HND39_04860 [Ignavibacteriota bacterium]|jgi:hypothetical protein|nr:MAG: hypothetical protein EDM72_11530 [Chlorobiota bacterium]MBE7475591.1 hypothetical protein [Ignavibacteriales bacterium]MBL1123099.1 hypothetical protein [Ignavibacteriota bacterium]MCC7092571.1 hypothetical protein [Ignavibacteriaceae bacterium]MCE7855688.1 hypothetical protein [Ignavibacteria bacterium CHB3]MEB2295915.1 hypothetical protein [Ignavibacteria bacterium]
MRLTEFILTIILFIVISALLSFWGILSLTISDLLSYSLIAAGILTVYDQSIKQNGFPVFIGSVIFLLGTYFLISENFSLNLGDGIIIPLVLVFAGAGLLMFYIVTSIKKYFLIISLVCLLSGIIYLLMNSRWNIKSFLHSVLPVLNYLWPAIIILAFLIFLFRKK